MKSKGTWIVLFTILMQGLSACTSISTVTVTPTPEAAGPEEIVRSFYEAMNNGDLGTAMTFIADDIACRGHCYITGKSSFQTFIQGNIDHNDQFEISNLRINGDKITFDYVIYRGDAVSARGVDSVMQIQAGKIVYFEIN